MNLDPAEYRALEILSRVPRDNGYQRGQFNLSDWDREAQVSDNAAERLVELELAEPVGDDRVRATARGIYVYERWDG